MNARIRELRKSLGYSQKEFADMLGIAQTSVSYLERDGATVTEQNIKSICREFDVDYAWLTTGIGEMFSYSEDATLELIDRIMTGENEFHKNLFKTFARFDEEELKYLEKMIDKFIDIRNS